MSLRESIADAVDRYLHQPDSGTECTPEEYRESLLELADEIVVIARDALEAD